MDSPTNVTPIRPQRTPKKRPVKIGLKFAASTDDDGFSTHDVFKALCGVCKVMDEEVGLRAFSPETNGRLAMAANILANLLESRYES